MDKLKNLGPELTSGCKQCSANASQRIRSQTFGDNQDYRHIEARERLRIHYLYGQHPAERRLKSMNCFLRYVKPAELFSHVIRCNEWLGRLQTTPHKVTVNLSESLAIGYDSPWTTWRCLNRLRTGFTCSKEQRQKWGYFEGDVTCECGLATENTAHMMQCTLLARPCSLDDLNSFNDIAKKCVERWKTQV